MKGLIRINEMFAFIVVDDDGTEGIPAMNGPDGLVMPLVGADIERIASLRRYAVECARGLNKTVTLVKFSHRTELEVITAGGDDDPS